MEKISLDLGLNSRDYKLWSTFTSISKYKFCINHLNQKTYAFNMTTGKLNFVL